MYVYMDTLTYMYITHLCIYTCSHTSADPVCEVVKTYSRSVRCKLYDTSSLSGRVILVLTSVTPRSVRIRKSDFYARRCARRVPVARRCVVRAPVTDLCVKPICCPAILTNVSTQTLAVMQSRVCSYQ